MAEVMFLGINGSVQDKDSGNTSLLIRSGGCTVMVDASSGLHLALEASPDALVVTHTHTDHVYAIPSLIHQMWLTGRKKEFRIYGSGKTLSLVRGLISLFDLENKKGMFPISLMESEAFREGPLSFETFRTDHTDSSIGMFVRDDDGTRILYSSDTRPISDCDERWMGTDLLIHEASGSVEDEDALVKKGHSSYADAAVFAKKTGASCLMLCHLPPGEKNKEKALSEASEIFPSSRIPHPFQWIKI